MNLTDFMGIPKLLTNKETLKITCKLVLYYKRQNSYSFVWKQSTLSFGTRHIAAQINFVSKLGGLCALETGVLSIA